MYLIILFSLVLLSINVSFAQEFYGPANVTCCNGTQILNGSWNWGINVTYPTNNSGVANLLLIPEIPTQEIVALNDTGEDTSQQLWVVSLMVLLRPAPNQTETATATPAAAVPSFGAFEVRYSNGNAIYSLRKMSLVMNMSASTFINLHHSFEGEAILFMSDDKNKFQAENDTMFVCNAIVPIPLLPFNISSENPNLYGSITFKNFTYQAFYFNAESSVEICPRDVHTSSTIPIATGVSFFGAGILGILALVIPRIIKRVKGE